MEENMIKFNVLYPNDKEGRFDFDYYKDKHVPLVMGLMKEACISMVLDRGTSAVSSSQPPAYIALATISCASVAALRNGLYPHLKAISADIPNFTNITPHIWVSEVIADRKP
jgi:uncharacterized protein (TIGR02118 family)